MEGFVSWRGLYPGGFISLIEMCFATSYSNALTSEPQNPIIYQIHFYKSWRVGAYNWMNFLVHS